VKGKLPYILSFAVLTYDEGESRAVSAFVENALFDGNSCHFVEADEFLEGTKDDAFFHGNEFLYK